MTGSPLPHRPQHRPRAETARGSIWQPHEPAFWIICGTILLCLPLSLRTMVAQDPEPTLAGLGAVVLIAQGTGLWLLASWVLGARALPRPLRLAAMSWGFIVAPVIAAFANTRWFEILGSHGLHSFAAAIAAPFDEDLLRFAGILGILAMASRSRRPTMLDGIGYGFLLGAGFEVSENLLFVLGVDDLQGGVQLALIRTGLGFGLHALWSGIQGALLVAAMRRCRSRPLAAGALLAGGLALPALLHATWDAPALALDYRWTLALLVTIYVISIGTLAALTVHARRSLTEGAIRNRVRAV